jgi:hypothetical protein
MCKKRVKRDLTVVTYPVGSTTSTVDVKVLGMATPSASSGTRGSPA